MTTIDEVLEHYGVKGMKWGVRRSRQSSSGPTDVVLKTKPGKKIKAIGGSGYPASEDATRTAISRQKAKKSTVSSLSNKELEDLVRRLNLERQYGQLTTSKVGKAFAMKLLFNVGERKLVQVLNEQLSSSLKK